MKVTSYLSLLGLFVYHASSSPVPQDAQWSDGWTPPGPTLPIGSWIRSCTVPGTIALTFDDGPVALTGDILDQLRDAGMAATFFINGVNWGNINLESSRALVRRMVAEGHQVGSHTWSHPFLTSMDRGGVINQMTQIEGALNSILGYHSTYMRPPYFDASAETLSILADKRYHVFHADIDTKDYANQSPNTIGNSIQFFKDGLDAGGSIVLAHDVHQYTADYLVPAMIAEIAARGLRAVPLGECLNDPKENWYRT